jgi:hypothetical protein
MPPLSQDPHRWGRERTPGETAPVRRRNRDRLSVRQQATSLDGSDETVIRGMGGSQLLS